MQEAPFADLSVHCGPRLMQTAVFDRFRRVLSVIPGDQRLVLDGTRPCGLAGLAGGQREARGAL